MYQTNNRTTIFEKFLLITLSLFVITTLMSIFTFSSLAADNTSAKEITLILNGKTLTPDVPPKIISSRTMIPARALFEEVGGDVKWNSTTKVVSITYEGHTIELTINSKKAKVDGRVKTLDVAAQIVNGRTLIPLRFVSESLSFAIDWDSSTYTVTIETPNYTSSLIDVPNNTPTEPDNSVETLNQIKKISVSNGSSSNMYTSVKIQFTEPITASDYSKDSLSNPSRYYFDFKNASVDKIYQTTLYTTADGHSSVKTVRGALNTTTTYRLVFDLNVVTTPTVTMSNDKTEMTIKFQKNSNYKEETTITTPAETTTNPSTGKTDSSSTEYNPYSDGKLVVVLDPGHGKSTGGKRSPDGTLREYEFNRSVANRIKTILENNGISVIVTAPDDTDVSLSDRCKIANNSVADIYVSIHANAFGNGIDWENGATGWEIYYYSESSLGKKLATCIHDANIPDIGIKDRGVKTANFYVIKNTNMPAVLIEHGFFTSKTEVELLKSSAWRQKAAELDAQGIMDFLYSYKK